MQPSKHQASLQSRTATFSTVPTPGNSVISVNDNRNIDPFRLRTEFNSVNDTDTSNYYGNGTNEKKTPEQNKNQKINNGNWINWLNIISVSL